MIMPPIRGLTQSEKHRLYVDVSDEDAPTKLLSKQLTRQKYVGSRVLECPQNSVEDRKLQKYLARLEHERQRKETQLTTQKHMLRMDHKKFLDSSLLMPGFRFHRNGETKIPKGQRDLCKSPPPLSKRSASVPTLPTRATSSMSTNRVSLNEQIDALKRELRHLKGSQLLAKVSRQRGAVPSRVQSNKGFIRAHTNDSPFNKLGISASPRSPTRKSQEEEKVDVSAERFSRKSSKPNCVACECSFHNTDSLELSERKRVPDVTKMKWRNPPKGYFLKSTSSLAVFSPSSTIASLNSKTNSKLGISSSTALVKKLERTIPLCKTMSGPPTSVTPTARHLLSPQPDLSQPLLSQKQTRKSSSAGSVRGMPNQEGENQSQQDGKGDKVAVKPSKPPVKSNSNQTGPSPERLPSTKQIKSQMERDEELLRNKVQLFVSSLPENKSAIKTWRGQHRSSAVSSRTMEMVNDDQSTTDSTQQHENHEKGDREQEQEQEQVQTQVQKDSKDDITWSRYNLSPTGASHIMSDIYLANISENGPGEGPKASSTDAVGTGAATGADDGVDKSFADLIHCRYLRIPPSVQKAWE